MLEKPLLRNLQTTDKILKKSTSFDSAFQIIEEHYGLLPSQETFCDFSSISRAPNEPYRQFYDRMIAFLSQHLMPHKDNDRNSVDGTDVPAGGDKISVTLMNMVAMMWLTKIHPDLLNLVRTEFLKELHDNVAMSALVLRISLSVDALLAKYDKVPTVNKFTLHDDAHGQQNEDTADVYRLRGDGRQGFRGCGGGGQGRRPERGQTVPAAERNFCTGCFYLGRQVNAAINYRHLPAECPCGPALVQLLEAEDAEILHDQSGKHSFCLPKSRMNFSYQEIVPKLNSQITNNDLEMKKADNLSCSPLNISDFMKNKERSESLLNRLSNNSPVKRTKSPSIWLNINGKTVIAVIDEGSEVTVIDHEFAKQAGIGIEKTSTSAKAAGNNAVQIMGQSVSNVIANVLNLRVPATLNFGHCLIVKNLGTTILIGQPTKVDHNIITNPRLNQIQFHDIRNVPHTIKYPLSPPKEYFESHVCRYDQTKILYPGDELEYQLPHKFSSVKRVVFSPRSELQQQGFQPTHYSLQPNLKMKILNETENKIACFKVKLNWTRGSFFVFAP